MPAQHYDAVVIGAGQGGVPLSQALARSGRSTALIEREHVGGTCINEGCTPTKTMVASAKTAYIDRRSAGLRRPQRPGRRRHARGAAAQAGDRGQLQRRQPAAHRGTEGLDLISGEASFTGPKNLAGPHERRRDARAQRRQRVYQRRRQAGQPPDRGSGRRAGPELHLHHGARRAAGAPAGARRQLRGPGVRPDVQPLRQRGHGRAAGRAADGPRGRRRRRGGGRDPARGRYRGAARDRDPARRAQRATARSS